ncbi:MAG: ABC transporter permease [Planctomycetes bacterium]|nr:ABC transporter permease [Planctomycetota bacterium]
MSPTRWILGRIAWMFPTLLGITLVVFLAVHAAPGDPAAALEDAVDGALSQTEAAERVARVRAEHLLDASLPRQYLHFLGPFDLSPRGHPWFGGSGEERWHGLLAFDFGDEFGRPGVPVAREITRRLVVTVPLSLAALLVAYLVAIPLGAWSALRDGTRRSAGVAGLLLLLDAMPTFWLALLAILALGPTGLDLLPVFGLSSSAKADAGLLERALDVGLHAVLPVLVLAAGSLAWLARHVRGSLLVELASDYARMARATGASEREVVWRHALPNALLPVLTFLGGVLPALVGGSVVVESVFGIEGLGRYAYEGLLRRDLNVILATTTLSAVLTLLGILLSDVAYAFVDPRLKPGGRRG